MKYPEPIWPDESKGKYSRGYFQKFVLAALWQRVAQFSTAREIKDPLEIGITELQLENVFGGLEPGQISGKLRDMEKVGNIQLAKTCHIWLLGPKQRAKIK